MTLMAPKSLPDSTPPLCVYKPSATLWTAGPKPEPKHPSIAAAVKNIAPGAKDIRRYEMMSTKRQTRASQRSKERVCMVEVGADFEGLAGVTVSG